MKTHTKVYDEVIELLTDLPETRNSDKLLFIEFWKKQGFVKEFNGSKYLDLSQWYVDKTAVESVRRCRAMIQADPNHFDLTPTDPAVAEARAKRASEKGTHVFREDTEIVREDLDPVQLDLGINAPFKRNWDNS